MQQHLRRSGIIIGLVAFGLLTGAALTASPAQAVSGPGPYYAEPAWDRKMGASNRFLILTNWNSEAVLDKETGLVWERTPQLVPSAWSGARIVCNGKGTGARRGWRLPSVHELASLVDLSTLPISSVLSLPLSHPFGGVQSATYWSATTDAENPTNAWVVGFGNPSSVSSTTKADTLPVWCVRGGMQADQY